MSEVIVRMEMPNRCGACKCRHVEFDIDRVAVFCAIKDNEYVEDPDSRPSWCPIVGVLPEDGFSGGVSAEITKACERQLESERDAEEIAIKEDLNRIRREIEELKRRVNYANTVIEAERKDNER